MVLPTTKETIMGYHSQILGNLSFQPSIDQALVDELTNQGSTFAYYGVFEPEGWFNDEESGKMYGLSDDAVALVGDLRTRGVDVIGTLVVIGEETDDIRRLVFSSGKVVEEKAKIVWPDGTEFTY